MAAKEKAAVNRVADLVKEYKKEHGDSIGSYGGSLLNTDRVPTGLFEFDLATGGGFPRGKCSVVYGPESSNKTNVVLSAIRNHQLLWPDLTCVFFDIEGEFNRDWAIRMGVNADKLVVMKPSYAEQCVDQAEEMLYAEDVGLVAIDSIAALVTTQEADSSAEKANVGGAGLVVGKLCRKTGLALREAEKKGRFPSLIYVNQIRHKVGVMFGDPETMPGGFMPRYQAALWVRFYGKNIKNPKVSPNMPVAKETSFQLKKWKVPVLNSDGKFEMITVPHNDMGVGETNDTGTVKEYLEGFGQFEKDKNGWNILGNVYPTQSAFADRCRTDKKFGAEVKQAIINRLLLENNLIGQGDLPEVFVTEDGEVVKVGEAVKDDPPAQAAKPEGKKKLTFSTKKKA